MGGGADRKARAKKLVLFFRPRNSKILFAGSGLKTSHCVS